MNTIKRQEENPSLEEERTQRQLAAPGGSLHSSTGEQNTQPLPLGEPAGTTEWPPLPHFPHSNLVVLQARSQGQNVSSRCSTGTGEDVSLRRMGWEEAGGEARCFTLSLGLYATTISQVADLSRGPSHVLTLPGGLVGATGRSEAEYLCLGMAWGQ